MTPHHEWTQDELWQHEQMNFAAHMAMMFTYLQKHGLDVADFVRYTAEQVIGGWQDEVKTAAEMLNAVLVNVRANGGEVLDASLDSEDQTTARVTRLLNEETMSLYGSPVDVASHF